MVLERIVNRLQIFTIEERAAVARLKLALRVWETGPILGEHSVHAINSFTSSTDALGAGKSKTLGEKSYFLVVFSFVVNHDCQ